MERRSLLDVGKWLSAGLVVAVVAVGLWAFEPWRLFTDSEVDEPLPVSTRGAGDRGGSGPGERRERPARGAADVVDLARGEFVDAEHDTSGVARVIELADGRRFVRLEDLATSDGPDLHVWITDRPSGGDWGSYDDGRYVRLGELKANNGNQNYPIPEGVELGGLTSVVIWCDRFDVAFGTAPVDL